MALDILIAALYLYILGRSLSAASEDTRMETELTKEKWKKAAKEVDSKMVEYIQKKQIQETLKKQQGLEYAGTINGGVAAPEEPPSATREDSGCTEAKKGNAGSLMSTVTSMFPFLKSKKD